MNPNTCLVCGYSGDPDFYPGDYNICDCCGTEFGYDDRVLTHEQLRNEWIANDYPWFYSACPPPAGWDPIRQLRNAGLIEAEPFLFVRIRIERPSVSYQIASNTVALMGSSSTNTTCTKSLILLQLRDR